MKVALVSDYFQPKIGYTKVQVTKELQKLGHEVKIITSDRYFPFHNYESTTKKILGNRIRSVGTKTEHGFKVQRLPIVQEAFSRVLIPGLPDAIKKFRPDLVIVVGISTYTAYQVAQLKSTLGFKLVLADSHLPSEFNSGNILFKKLFYFFFRLFFSKSISNAADKVIAIQDDTKPIISDVYGIRKKISVVPNGTDINLFRFSAQARNTTRKHLGVSKSAIILIYTGKVIKNKGVDLLFSAFNSVRAQHSNVHLLIVGSGPKEYEAECFSKVTQKYQANIHMVGFKQPNELYKYYSAADIALWPLQESLAMNDAAACNLPFIANNTLGDKTRISNNNALLYKKGSVTDLSKKINLLISDKSLRKQMGKNGRELMIQKLSWKKIAEQFL